MHGDDVAAHAAHHDPVTHIKGPATQDDTRSRARRDDLLQGEGESGCDEPERSRQPGRVVELDRKHTKDQQHGRDDLDALADPELRRHIIAPSQDAARQPAEQRAERLNRLPKRRDAIRLERYLKSGSGRAFAKRHFDPSVGDSQQRSDGPSGPRHAGDLSRSAAG